jgi:ribosomal protein S11
MVVNTFVSRLASTDVEMNIYPNPSGGQFSIHLKGLSHENTLIEIVNLQGKILVSRTIGKIQNESTTQFDLNLANGIYIVKMQSGANTVVKRLVIQ